MSRKSASIYMLLLCTQSWTVQHVPPSDASELEPRTQRLRSHICASSVASALTSGIRLPVGNSREDNRSFTRRIHSYSLHIWSVFCPHSTSILPVEVAHVHCNGRLAAPNETGVQSLRLLPGAQSSLRRAADWSPLYQVQSRRLRLQRPREKETTQKGGSRWHLFLSYSQYYPRLWLTSASCRTSPNTSLPLFPRLQQRKRPCEPYQA